MNIGDFLIANLNNMYFKECDSYLMKYVHTGFTSCKN